MTKNDEGLEALRAVVVKQACKDYIYYLKHPNGRLPYGVKKNCYDTKRQLLKWFHSPEFVKFTELDPDRILKQMDYNFKHGIRFYSLEDP